MTRRERIRRPNVRAIYMAGHSDGERGNKSRSLQYSGWQRQMYEKGRVDGYAVRHRMEYERKRHGNTWRSRG